MIQIQLNHPDRDKVKPLTVEEENQIVEMINFILNKDIVTIHGELLLQSLISNYENLCHYKARTSNYDLLLKKVEQQEKEISNLTIDLNQCGQSLQEQYKKNERLTASLQQIIDLKPHASTKAIDLMIMTLAKQAIENNK